jgi:hypothetical protein
MSLFESASLVVTPNGTKASKLYAIKPTDGSGDLTVTRATTATRVNSAGLIESVAVNVPRLDYTNSTCPSILVESQRTNVLTNSDGLITTYPTRGGNIVQAVTPISGFSNSVEFQNNLTTSYLYKTFGTTSGTTYSISAFVQMNDNSIPNPGLNVASSDFSLLISGELATNLNVQKIGNSNVYRVSGRFTSINVIANYGVLKFTTQSAKGFKVTGYQLETASYATSYIPTVASAVTRNADVINKTGITALIGQTEGTIYAEIKVSKLLGTASRYIFHLSDGTANNRIYMAFSGSSSNIIRARIFNGGTLQCSIDSSTISATGTYKLALAYKNNDIVFYINGVQIGTDTSATIPTCSRVDLGHNYAGASQFNDSINNANVWKTRLSNSELATLTTL